MEKDSEKFEEYPEAIDLLPGYFDSTLSEAELKIVEEWMASESFDSQLYDASLKIHSDIKALKVMEQVDVDKAYKRVSGRLWHHRHKFLDVIRNVAAILAMPLMVAIVWLYVSDNNRSEELISMNELRTSNGMTGRVMLPDSTIVVLNARSVLRYPSKFYGSTRNVELEGEAYFEVARDEKRQFSVSMPNRGSVNVYGTHFNLAAYPGEEHTVTLLEGSIGYKYCDETGNTKEIRLHPSEKLTCSNDGMLTLSHVSGNEETDWTLGKIIVDNTSLRTILQKLGRKYDVEFKVENPQFYDMTFSGGSISTNSLEYVLQTLAISSDLKWEEVSDGLDDTTHSIIRIY